MALGIAAILHARYRDLGWIIASCVATITLARLFAAAGITLAGPFATAFCIGLATNLASRYLRIPSAVVLVPSLLVLVPGSISYESLLYVFQADATDALSLAARALMTAILIVAGWQRRPSRCWRRRCGAPSKPCGVQEPRAIARSTLPP